ncbi:3-beta hydroxysteroid dehydrogenase/isomerase family protein [Ancylostoma ceylanicum]|uniref:3-beta hydroxysteroid dehydrogenase/isomerase family protein n=1 Tax=Ancylostoma ceylanicum TaxID=53326 RepID=A0A0D6MD71_9BILA|nr:3-beta hydroxysteroid dehydrogenase/isomerase family protein [Ancylostoma ceylanicum]
MRVCIVGGGGYLGCELAARLQSHGAHTVILDVSFAGHPSIQLDERLTTRIQFNRDLINRINVDGTALLMDCCKRVGVTRFIFASSVGVIFTGKELVNATEDYPYPDESEDIIHKGLYIATFAQKGRAITQYSGIHNVTHAMCQADKELARPFPRCAGKVYHIVDANPVDSFLFWMPLITALSRTPPTIRLPFSLIYFVAYIAECLAVWFGIPPMMNRLEVNLVGITNTYSIERAIKDFDYKPTKNHDLTEIVDYYTKYYKDRPGTKLDVRRTFKILIASVMLLFIVIRCYFS